MVFYSDFMGFCSDSMGYSWDLPSGNLLQFAIEHGPVEIADFPTKSCDFLWFSMSYHRDRSFTIANQPNTLQQMTSSLLVNVDIPQKVSIFIPKDWLGI